MLNQGGNEINGITADLCGTTGWVLWINNSCIMIIVNDNWIFLSYKSYKPTLLKSCHGNSRRLPWKRAGCSFPAHSSWACTLPFPLLTTHEQKLLFRAAGEKCITINIFILKTVYFLAFQLIPYGEWASWPSVAVPHLTTGAAEAVPGKIGSHVVQWSRL